MPFGQEEEVENPTMWSLANYEKNMGNTGKAGCEIYVLMTFFLRVMGERNELHRF